jgi:hypothetical protein
MLLFYGGDEQIDARRRDEAISQFEGEEPAKEATPVQKPTDDVQMRPIHPRLLDGERLFLSARRGIPDRGPRICPILQRE